MLGRRILPSIEDGDLDSRSEPLANMLDDAERSGIRFPNVVRCVPLFGNHDAAQSFQSWSLLRTASNAAAKDAFDKAVAATTAEQLQTKADDLELCQTELASLLAELETKLGPSAPSLTNLGTAISDCRGLVRQELSRLVPAAAVAGAAGETANAGQPGIVGTRHDAYQQLNRAADFLQQIEPHSPVPYLVRRAVELGALPFPRLMQQLIRDSGVLAELNREMGVREAAGTGS